MERDHWLARAGEQRQAPRQGGREDAQALECQREAGGAWEQHRASDPRRGLRPWALRWTGPHGATERLVVRGPAWRDGMGAVGEPRTTARTANQLEAAPLVLLWMLYAVPVRLLSLTTDLRDARRLREALA